MDPTVILYSKKVTETTKGMLTLTANINFTCFIHSNVQIQAFARNHSPCMTREYRIIPTAAFTSLQSTDFETLLTHFF